jgi:hypothetical protein
MLAIAANTTCLRICPLNIASCSLRIASGGFVLEYLALPSFDMTVSGGQVSSANFLK